MLQNSQSYMLVGVLAMSLQIVASVTLQDCFTYSFNVKIYISSKIQILFLIWFTKEIIIGRILFDQENNKKGLI